MAFKLLIPAFLGGLAASAMLTPLVRRFVQRAGFYAEPVQDRWHRRPVAMLGGVAIAVAFGLVTVAMADLRPILPLLLCAGLMFALGTVDDVSSVTPATKVVVQMLVASLLIYLAPPIRLTGIAVLDSLVAFAWIVGITNAFNLLDNIDGLAAGVAAIAGFFYLAILIPAGPSSLTLAIAVFVGAVIGFLVYNFHPASIFMGDGGSLFLGSFLAGVSLLAAPELKAQLAQVAAIPLLVLIIPIFDTGFVTLTRQMAGRSALKGGRDHTSHRLVALGISERRAVGAFYALTALGGGLALVVRHMTFGNAAVLISLYLIVIAGLGVVLSHVDAHDGQAGRGDSRRAPLVSELTYRYRIYEVLLDVALIAVSYYAGFRMRFDASQIEHFVGAFAASFPLVIGCQLAGLWSVGKYRNVWRTFGATELLTILRGIAYGVAASIIVMLYVYRFQGFSRTVFVVDGVLLSFLLIGSRVAITSVDEYLRKGRTRGRRVLIYGAGRVGALLAREFCENNNLGLTPVGFVDDDPGKRRLKLEGVPVIGTGADLAEIAKAHGVSEVVISFQDLPPDRYARIAALCRQQGLGVRRMRFVLEEVEPIGAKTHDEARVR